MRFRFYIGLLCCFLGVNVYSQETQSTVEELLLEQISEELGEEVDVSEVMEQLNHYLRKPLDLNNVSEEQLANLIFLSPQQVMNIIAHRQQSGDFISLLELQGVMGLDLKTINMLLPFVRIGDQSTLKNLSWKRIREEDEHSLMIRYSKGFEDKAGYLITDENRSRYLGDGNAYALRYRWNYNQKIKIGLNAEKDAGEPFFAYKQSRGFDFYSGYLEINDYNKSIKKIIIGDYGMQVGQGLVLWNGINFGKGALIHTVAKQGVGLRAYSSMNENNFQRGIAIKTQFGRLKWTPFFAYNKLSGNVEHTDSISYIKTINYSGLHRTPTEQAYKVAISQWVIGSDWSYQYKRLQVGFVSLYTRFSGTVAPGEAIREQYDFSGKHLLQLAANYKFNYRNAYFFGETAHSMNSGVATVNGMIVSLHPKVSVFFNYRNFQKNYHSFFAQAISEGSNVVNESGLYTGLVYQITRKFEWINYVDRFKSPWLRFRVDGPSEGVDFLSQATYSWYKKGKFVIRYRYRLKQENLTLPAANENILADVVRNQIRLEYQYKLNDSWNIRTRGELSLFDKKQANRSEGYLFYQDAHWRGLRNKLQLNARVSYFNTKDYDSRIYSYESDVLYACSFPMYYDKGIRTYLNMRYRLFRSMDVWMRYAMTKYLNRENIGSGLDLIDGDKKSDIKLQVRWQW